MATGYQINTAGLTANESGYSFGSGRHGYRKWIALDPSDTTTGAIIVPTSDAISVRVSITGAQVGDTVQLSALAYDGPASFLKVPVGAVLDADNIVYLTEIPEALEVERVDTTGANVEVVVDAYLNPTQR